MSGIAGNRTADLMASLVVFLVALPLCMGVAIASGVPPALGLATGIVGGLVVGALAGQPFQVSGPAAGLAVMVWQLVKDFGLEALGYSVLVCGVTQAVAGWGKCGRWFRAVSPALIQGMLAGIGVIIFAGQFHVMIDDKPRASPLADLVSIPQSVYKALTSDGPHSAAAAIGVGTIACILAWDRFRPQKLKLVPGPLLGVTFAVLAGNGLRLPISFVEVPDDLVASMNWLSSEHAGVLLLPKFWIATLGLALIASTETLLCATAVDRLHSGARTDYDQELVSQGVGNILCGFLGALPVCGVIVRSSANVAAGATSRASAIMHGAWILLLVLVAPGVLGLIPTASLAAILVLIGFRLVNFPMAKALWQKGRSHFAVWAATVLGIMGTDLLVGVAIGLAAAMLRVLMTLAKVDVEVEQVGRRFDVRIHGAATFMSLPKLASALESIPDDSEVHVHLDDIAYLDHACIELLEDWHERHPGEVYLETDGLIEKNHPSFVRRPQTDSLPQIQDTA